MYTQMNSYVRKEQQHRYPFYPCKLSSPINEFSYFWNPQYRRNVSGAAQLCFCPCSYKAQTNRVMNNHCGHTPVHVNDANWGALNTRVKVFPQSGRFASYSPSGSEIAQRGGRI